MANGRQCDVWIKENTEKAIEIKEAYKVPGDLDMVYHNKIVPFFRHYASTIDVCETNNVMRSEKLNIAIRFRNSIDKLPKTPDFDHFKTIFLKHYNNKVFKPSENVLTTVDYLLCMLIPHKAYKTLSILGCRIEAKEWMEPILEKIGELVDSSSEVSETPAANDVSKFFAGLNKKIKCSQQEAYLQQYGMLPDVPEDLPNLTILERSNITLDFWTTYAEKHGHHPFANAILEQLVGFVGTDLSERSFSITGQHQGTRTSEGTCSFKTCIKTGRNTGLYQLLVDELDI